MADNKQKNIPATTGNWFVDKLSLYQSANSDNSSIKKNFVIRQEEFELIIDSLANKKNNDPLQHELVLGRRGSGKSTLLRRIQAEVEENPALQKKYIAINLAEEQAGIYRLFDLWEEVLKEMSIKLNEQLPVKNYDDFDDNNTYTRHLYDVIHEALSRHNKKVVLLLDNFDRIVTNFTDDGSLLREILMNHNDIVLVAGSTRMDEHFWKYDQPFYEFFRRHRLEALDIKEIIELLNHWSKVMELPQLAQFAKNNIGKLEAIRILTDGLPRTLQFFIQILLQNSDLYGYEYLRKVMDNVTTLYQERLNNLPAAQRKIIAEMAFIWEACATKELVEKCRMESKLVSANIKQLANAGIVDIITTDKKNHLYRISERFFNMWLIVTQGNPEQKRRAKWLSIFLEAWYDVVDIKRLADEHIENLKNKKLCYDKALVFTKAFSQSKYITTNQRDQLIDLTIKIQPTGVVNSMLELPLKYNYLAEQIDINIREKNFSLAHKLVKQIENESDGYKFFNEGYIFHLEKKFDEAESNYLLAIQKNNIEAYNNLANIYIEKNKLNEAEKLYLHAIKNGHIDSLFNLAILYHDNMKRYNDAEKYYLLAIEKNILYAFNGLGRLYKTQGRFTEAEKYLLLGIENDKALLNLANLYKIQEKYSDAERCFKLAIERKIDSAKISYGNMLLSMDRLEEAEKLFRISIEEGYPQVYNNLGLIYAKMGKNLEAEKYYRFAIEKNYNPAFNNLANLYVDLGQHDKAEEYYILAIEANESSAIKNLAIFYYDNKKQKQKALDLIEKYLTIEKNDVDANEIHIILKVWNGQFDTIREDIQKIITAAPDKVSPLLFLNLLKLEQTHIVQNVFNDATFGKELQKRHEPLYYAIQLLSNKSNKDLDLRIPPEISETVQKIIQTIT